MMCRILRRCDEGLPRGFDLQVVTLLRRRGPDYIGSKQVRVMLILKGGDARVRDMC